MNTKSLKSGRPLDAPLLVEGSPCNAPSQSKVSTEDKRKIAITQLNVCYKEIERLCVIEGYEGKRVNLEGKTICPTVKHWITLSETVGYDWVKVMKYKLAAYFAFHEDQTLPTYPFGDCVDKPGHLVGAGLGRWLLIQLNKNIKLKGELLQSIKQTKKGMPRPSKRDLDEATEKFLDKMTAESSQEGNPILLDTWAAVSTEIPQTVESILTQDTVKAQLRRTVSELFRGHHFSNEDREHAMFPSTSANYNRSRKGCGAVGELLDHPTLLSGLRDYGGRMHVHYEPQSDESDERQEEERIPVVVEKMFEGRKELDWCYATMWWRLLQEALAEDPLVDPVALAEALKVRMITKGPPLTQTVLKALQKFLHRILRIHPAFRLIGEPVTEAYVLDRMGLNLKEGEIYLSGDYAAATDNLKSWVSECIADEISEICQLRPEEAILFKRALTQHWMVGNDGTLRRQTIGQLMGSIVSFPVLCIANAAMCRWSLELAERKVIRLTDSKMMINGDDCTMRAPFRLYRYWHDITDFCGLTESLGKTYQSEHFLEINSTRFQRDQESHSIEYKDRQTGRIVQRETFLRMVKYVNLGLLTGIKRSGGKVGLGDQADAHNSLAVRSKELLRLAPDRLRTAVMREFIREHKELLVRTRLPWYMPEWLGGVGLPSGEWGGNSELDLRVAHAIVLNWKQGQPLKLPRNTPWKIWQRAKSLVPPPLYTTVKGPHTEAYNAIVGRKCIDLLFNKDISLDDIYDDVEESKTNVSRAIEHNAKLWQAKRYKALPKPLREEDIETRRLYECYGWVEELDNMKDRQRRREKMEEREKIQSLEQVKSLD